MIPNPGDLVRVPGREGLWYVTRCHDHTMSLLRVKAQGDWLITDREDVDEVLRPDHWNADD